MKAQLSTDSSIKISIILPIYNVGEFLTECLQSIADQSLEYRIEALLIDDCSTDNSMEICEQFVRAHPTIFVLIKNPENQGVSVARNIGLENSRGQYFMFVDPDDVLPSDALANLYLAAMRCDPSIVKGNNTIFDDRDEREARYNIESESLVKGDEVLTVLFAHEKVRGHAWGKLFNRVQLGHIRFPVGVRMAQDLYYCGQVFSEAQSLLLINQNVYCYRNRNTGSTGRKFETGAYIDWLDSVEGIGKFSTSICHERAHKSLLVRTMAQIARECRKIPAANARQVLDTIEQRCQQWNIRLYDLIVSDKLGLRTISRYIKLQLALNKIRRNLSKS